MVLKSLVLSCLLALTYSASVPQKSPEPVAILTQSRSLNPDGKYEWSFESEDGIKETQSGEPKKVGNATIIVVTGSYSYADKNGTQHNVSYIADEEGYRAVGSDIPEVAEPENQQKLSFTRLLRKQKKMVTKVFLLSVLVTVALSAPQEPSAKEPVPVVAQENDIDVANGKFRWSFESGDGTKQEQNGEIRGTGEDAGPAVQGSYSWKDTEGKEHSISYTADENGYKAQGEDIPVTQEIPQAILKSLEYNAAHPEQEETQSKT
ncbi:uncharacterized protein LOC132697106 [Cylas formicarius]|uniref:uncharacterized protein LOC132697106 n=1 Tax=Cylas formicarius TaxID=197179 RepID=UPI002958C441|nr:uncharacterized protein LOC132697106 [Cylas formicarius]